MNHRWEESGDRDERGWRRVRCVRCGFVSGWTPHPFARIHGRCQIAGWLDWIGFISQLVLGVELAQVISWWNKCCMFRRGAAVLLGSFWQCPEGDPGDVLAALLHKIGRGYFPTKGCNSCQGHIDTMNAEGVVWCAANVPTIVGWLAASAQNQRLPFSQWGAMLLVRRSIGIAASRHK